jgi:hypothetical protein
MTKINVFLGRKITDGNFGNFDLQFGVEAETLPGETTEAGFDRVYALVEKKLIEHATEVDDAVSETIKKKKTYGK